ncbi:hypothetical protein [Ferruginibacter albus]|uniref:hypothetical protein n=1 Tax=Ferruginibacter albus TaxID=2875540 RepID=UPI001CC7E7A6|nr:hypothetical protein [Ferruginibacter albus]UAY52464.1 hypothetical protein K9M53_01950 [Ferruginibacter albus]
MSRCHFLYRYLFIALTIVFLGNSAPAQTITYSEPMSGRVAGFDVIAKMNNNFLILTNNKSTYSINVFDNDMKLQDATELNFMQGKVLKTSYVVYPDFFYLFYEFQQKGISHCMAAKLNSKGKLLADPVELDTSKIEGDNSIYNVVKSDDKKQIIIIKVLQKKGNLYYASKLFNDSLALLHAGRESMPFDDNRNVLSDYLIDNDGILVFTKAYRKGNRQNISQLSLVTKMPYADSFVEKSLPLNDNYLDEIKLKIDNFNRHYLISSFYYDQRQSNIDGIYCNIWDKQTTTPLYNIFTPLPESLKQEIKSGGSTKQALNNFFIRNVIVKKDGGYVLMAEDYSTQTNNYSNPWNRWDYLYGSPFGYNPYYYNPYMYWYRPYNDPYYNQTTRYFYNNVLVLNIDSTGKQEWNTILHKEQSADNDESYLSFLSYNVSGEIHLLYNEIGRRKTLMQESAITQEGVINRNPLLKTTDNDFEFMPKFGKQVSARQVIVPCTIRNSICFAKIDY